MTTINIARDLDSRGLLHQASDEALDKKLSELAAKGMISAYAGFDPTADSLHVGHFIGIRALMFAQKHGIRPIAIVGGATGLIGDPSGRASERSLISKEQVEQNVLGLKGVLSKFLDFNHPTAPAIIVNNVEWFGAMSAIDFLRDVGKHFRVGAMLSKESVKKRMEQDAEGMSYTEFSYQLLQGYDFYRLYKNYGCVLQMGGSDQWGNIIAGVDLVRKIEGESGNVFAVTLPLITDSQGNKFGKSAGNAVWMTADKTSVYDFYQFWLRSEDADVERYLKLFTFVELSVIAELMAAHAQAPHQRQAQKKLAEEMTRLVHGQGALEQAQAAAQILFGGAIVKGIDAGTLGSVFSQVPSVGVTAAELEAGLAVVPLVVKAGLAKSNGEARKLIEGGGFYVNNLAWGDAQKAVTKEDLITADAIVLRGGKKNYRMVKVGG
jgi:tyrosyl-tRNA synthetase